MGVKWLKLEESNLLFFVVFFPPQGRQGPEWSDFRLRASAGLIEWCVFVSLESIPLPFHFLSLYIFLFLSIYALISVSCVKLPSLLFFYYSIILALF